MNPIAITLIIVVNLLVFAWSANRRWQLLRSGAPEPRFDRIGERIKGVWEYAFKQKKMAYYQPAGIAHKLIFLGFMVLLLRSIILWGRGFSPTFNLFVLEPWSTLGMAYEFAKDVVAILVLMGVSVFAYYRIIKPQKRMTQSAEAVLILCIIATMMLSDMMYDGASSVLKNRYSEFCGSLPTEDAGTCSAIDTIIAPLGQGAHPIEWALFPSPGGSAFAVGLKSLEAQTLVVLAHIGFWTHSTLVLVFLNLLPHSKHFHVITAIPNVFFRSLDPPGRLRPMAKDAEALMEVVGKAAEADDPMHLKIGAARPEHFSWKAILDFYTCTECGRCSDNCPAHTTGKILSPKHLTLELRDHLYAREDEVLEKQAQAGRTDEVKAESKPEGEEKSDDTSDESASTPAEASDSGNPELGFHDIGLDPVNLVPDVIHPDVLWACTTCRACEEQCPVMISYVDKIVDMRRNLVLVRGEFPHELQKPFQGMEVNGNPWNLSRMDRAAWCEGLEIPTLAQKPDAEVLYWVGCAASYDDRAKKIARATARLLKLAGVDFAILGEEENCTGDPARRAGNEFLFAMLAEGNAAVLNGYKEQGGAKTVVTACPHCFNTLKNEYADFGVELEVVHHADFLMGLVAEKKLLPTKPVEGKVTYHDSCYLGRYNGVYESPREILRAIPGVELVEPEYWTKQRGLCCGAGGAQMFMEEQNQNRVNVKRTLQLVDSGAKTIASACPFCMTMLTDGLKSQSLEDEYRQLDVAELLDESCEEVVQPAEPTHPESGEPEAPAELVAEAQAKASEAGESAPTA